MAVPHQVQVSFSLISTSSHDAQNARVCDLKRDGFLVGGDVFPYGFGRHVVYLPISKRVESDRPIRMVGKTRRTVTVI